MSFIGPVEAGKVYAPGWFLAHEECERKTRQFSQEMSTCVTAANGGKYIPMGSLYVDESGDSPVIVGIVYEDVDVTNGDMPGSVVLKGVVYGDRLVLPDGVTLPTVASALAAIGITVKSSPEVSRPDEFALNPESSPEDDDPVDPVNPISDGGGGGGDNPVVV